jgi:hypothetical protein
MVCVCGLNRPYFDSLTAALTQRKRSLCRILGYDVLAEDVEVREINEPSLCEMTCISRRESNLAWYLVVRLALSARSAASWAMTWLAEDVEVREISDLSSSEMTCISRRESNLAWSPMVRIARKRSLSRIGL